jgi:hypothetical protein
MRHSTEGGKDFIVLRVSHFGKGRAGNKKNGRLAKASLPKFMTANRWS